MEGCVEGCRLAQAAGWSEHAALSRQAGRSGGGRVGRGLQSWGSRVRAELQLSCQGSGPAADFGHADSPAQEGPGSILPLRSSLGKRQLLGLAQG